MQLKAKGSKPKAFLNMKKLIIHIIRLALGILPVVLAVGNTAAQIVVDQCDTMEFSVTSRPNIPESHFVWGIYEASDLPTDVLDPAGTIGPVPYFVNDQYAGRTVQVVGLDPGKYYVRIHVWDEVSCTDNIEMYVMEVVETTPEIVLEGDSVCIGDPVFVKIIFSGLAPYRIDYIIGDELTGSWVNLNGQVDPDITIPIMAPLPVGATTFWVMEVSDDCKVITYEEDERPNTGILIFPKPVNSQIYLKDGD